MSMSYTHLLISTGLPFTPDAKQVQTFLDAMHNAGALPAQAKYSITEDKGTTRNGRNAYTGEVISVPIRDRHKAPTLAAAIEIISTLLDYELVITGEGASPLEPFPLFVYTPEGVERVTMPYHYQISCCVRPQPVSMTARPLDALCSAPRTDATFNVPALGFTTTVPNAGCSSFWIEFEFGNWLFPQTAGSLDLLHSSILAAAHSAFGCPFAQGGYSL